MEGITHASLFEPGKPSAEPPTNQPDTKFHTRAVLASVIAADEDFEWYPTTARMIAAVMAKMRYRTCSIMDIGAGDGRVLQALAAKCEHPPSLYSIEKSTVLLQAQHESIVPLGTDFYEQNLTALPVDVPAAFRSAARALAARERERSVSARHHRRHLRAPRGPFRSLPVR